MTPADELRPVEQSVLEAFAEHYPFHVDGLERVYRRFGKSYDAVRSVARLAVVDGIALEIAAEEWAQEVSDAARIVNR